MDLNLDDVDIALVVNVEILRQVLKKLSSNGKRWWISLRARVRAGERFFDDWLWRSRLRRSAQYRLLQAPPSQR
jgi:hypothetical protein